MNLVQSNDTSIQTWGKSTTAEKTLSWVYDCQLIIKVQCAMCVVPSSCEWWRSSTRPHSIYMYIMALGMVVVGTCTVFSSPVLRGYRQGSWVYWAGETPRFTNPAAFLDERHTRKAQPIESPVQGTMTSNSQPYCDWTTSSCSFSSQKTVVHAIAECMHRLVPTTTRHYCTCIQQGSQNILLSRSRTHVQPVQNSLVKTGISTV